MVSTRFTIHSQRESTGSSVASLRAGRVTADGMLIISFTHRQ
jgi:hypothetical protein